MKKLLLSTVTIAALSTSAMATADLKQNINLGLVSTTGNTETLNVNGKYDEKYTTSGYNNQDLSVVFDASAFMTKTDHEKNNEEYQINLGLEQILTDGWLVYANTGWLRNEFLNYDDKVGASIGVGKEIFKDAQQNLSVKVGVGYNAERYTNGAKSHKFTSVNEYVEYNNQLNKVSNFFLKVGAIENVKEFSDDYDAFGTIGFNFAVAENLSVTLSEEVRYDNLAAAGLEKTDTKTVATVGYHF